MSSSLTIPTLGLLGFHRAVYRSVEIQKLSGCGSVGRVRGLGPWGRKFESCLPDINYGDVAQLVERWTENPGR